jgi:hypothetical protein
MTRASRIFIKSISRVFLLAFFFASWVVSSWGAFSLTVTIKNISDNAAVSQATWSSVTPTWKEADQYLEVDYFSDQSGWGVQIYTDNHHAGADPAYTGDTTAGWEGAGLVGVTAPSYFVPMAWTAQTATGTARPDIITTDIYGTLDSNKGYAYFKDPMQQVVGNNPFVPGDDYITLINVNGLATNKPSWRIAASSPVYVYLIANFIGRPNQTYRTNQLIVELYHQ